MTVLVQPYTVFLCHRCPYFDRNRGHAGRCLKAYELNCYAPLKKDRCVFLTERQMHILNYHTFIPVASDLEIKPVGLKPNECFECGVTVPRTVNHAGRSFCRKCAGKLRRRKYTVKQP